GRLAVPPDGRRDQPEDAFGNIPHVFPAGGPFSGVGGAVGGGVETRDTQGIVRGVVERFPPSLYLRATALTSCDPNIAAFAAASLNAAGGNVLNLLHLMLARLHADMIRDSTPTRPAITAAQAFSTKRGAAPDFAHVFIPAARSLGIPARYVGGYFRCDDEVSEQDAGHPCAQPF